MNKVRFAAAVLVAALGVTFLFTNVSAQTFLCTVDGGVETEGDA